MGSSFGWLVVPALLLAACAGSRVDDDEYRREIEQHRAEREERLKAEDGWLSLVALVWLERGENRIGSDPTGTIVLVGEGVPAWAGTIHYDGSTARLEPIPGVPLTIGGQPAEPRTLRDDSEGEPDVIALGPITLHLIERGGAHGVRVRDPRSPARTEFHGIDYYPIDPAYRARGTFHPHDAPREVSIQTVIGRDERMVTPGWVELEVAGDPVRLEPMQSDSDPNELFFIFKDRTSGVDTYGAGRYLYATLEGDRVVVDFNRAFNPPCAFTPYATCPLPPRSNWLDVPIEAGEKKYGTH